MPQPEHITALDIEDCNNLDERRKKYIRILQHMHIIYADDFSQTPELWLGVRIVWRISPW